MIFSRSRLVLGLVAALVIVPTVMTAYADLSRESSLIERLGKQAAAPSIANKIASQDEIIEASRTIDQFIEAAYTEHKVQPNPPANDQIFMRRAYLDIIGRIPSFDETMDFLNSRDINKRAKLIDKLLDSAGHVSNDFNYWADVLRIKSDMYGGGQAYVDYVKDAIRTNMPYDKFVYSLVTAKGYTWEDGAAGYYLRDDGMPLDHLANDLQVFLGTSLVCAQCHDHPFDKWTQYEFYEMAAFTYGVNTRTEAPNVKQAKMMIKGDEPLMQTLDNIVRPLSYGVSVSNRNITLPSNYKYDDAKPNQVVKPFALFGDSPDLSKTDDVREAYAKWMTAKDNPRFAMVIANRMWKKVMGIGLANPIDAMTDDTKPSNPELLAYLTYKMKEFNFDLKQFERMLYNTRTYQRMVTVEDLPEEATYYFPGPLLHRMSAEQIWDSLMTLAIPDPDHRYGESTGRYDRGEQLAGLTPQQLIDIAKPRVEYDMKRREISKKIDEAKTAKNDALVKQLEKERRELKEPSMMIPMASMSGMSDKDKYKDRPKVDDSRWKDYNDGFKRASELRQPENYNHLLRQFGQADRELMSNACYEGNIIQVLAMFNGPITKWVMAPNSMLSQTLDKANNPADKLNVIFLSLLNRPPTPYERQVTGQMLGSQPDWDRVVWAVLNTREFSFVQ